jgi:hypothetical protein
VIMSSVVLFDMAGTNHWSVCTLWVLHATQGHPIPSCAKISGQHNRNRKKSMLV